MNHLLFRISIFYRLKRFKIKLIRKNLFSAHSWILVNQMYFITKFRIRRVFLQKDKKIVLILIIQKKTNVVWIKSASSANWHNYSINTRIKNSS